MKFSLGRQSSLAPRTLEINGSNEYGSTAGDIPFVPENLDKAMELLFLSSKGDKEAIAALLADGVDVSVADFDDRTALHVAACEGHAEVVDYLLKKGANVNARDRWGSTVSAIVSIFLPCFLFVMGFSIESLEILLKFIRSWKIFNTATFRCQALWKQGSLQDTRSCWREVSCEFVSQKTFFFH